MLLAGMEAYLPVCSITLSLRSIINHMQNNVEKKDKREEIGINALNAEISRVVARENELRNRTDAIVPDLESELA